MIDAVAEPGRGHVDHEPAVRHPVRAGLTMRHRAARELVVELNRRCVTDGLSTGTSGNLSVRVPEGILITPSGRAPRRTEPDDICLVDLDGVQLAGELPPSSEVPMHLAVYAATDAIAVVHTHAPMATAVSLTHDELPAVHYAIDDLGGPVRVAPYATFGTPELATNIAAALDGRTAAIMQNHGAITVGRTLEQAYERSMLLEWLCTLFFHAVQLGTPRVLSDGELREVREQMARLRYGSAP